MPHRRALTFLSLLVHAVALAAIVVVQLFAVGPLPTPHQPLVFENPRMVHLADITLPPTPQRLRHESGSPAPARTSPGYAAPIVAPTGTRPETGADGLKTAGPEVEGIEHGGGDGLDTIGGRVEAPPPPPRAPAAPIRLHEGMQMPRKIVDAAPAYPELARAAHREGVVILEAVIDTHGRVESVRVLRSIPLLDQAAVAAVRQWQFTPTLLNGEPVPIVMTVTVNFQLSR